MVKNRTGLPISAVEVFVTLGGLFSVRLHDLRHRVRNRTRAPHRDVASLRNSRPRAELKPTPPLPALPAAHLMYRPYLNASNDNSDDNAPLVVPVSQFAVCRRESDGRASCIRGMTSGDHASPFHASLM